MQKQSAFTIVELLIVIVVIGILAAITIVGFNGVQNRAKTVTLQSDLESAVKKLEAYRFQTSTNERYPVDLATAGITASPNNGLTYLVNNTTTPATYCVTATNGSTSYYANSLVTTAVVGDCDVKDDIVGWWKLNGNASDSSTHGYTGVITAATNTQGQQGAANTALNFNGSSAYLTTATLPAITNTSYAATVWFQTTAAGDRKIISTNSSSNHVIQIVAGGFLRSCRTGSVCVQSSTTNTADGKWHFAAVIGDTTGAKVYLDGNRTPEVSIAYSGSAAIGTALRIGAEYTPGYFFSGSIDDVRLYGRTLTLDEMQGIYAGGAQ